MKKIIIGISILLLLILLITFPAKMKDGGTVHYNAILYDIYDVHAIKPIDNLTESGIYETEYIEGIIIKVCGTEIFNNTNPHIDY